MIRFAELRRLSFRHPAEETPRFASSVERWYQLDAPAYGMALAADRWLEDWGKPGLLCLASPGASNDTDRDFVASGTCSPAKFIHTLPNVRASAMCQALGWGGTVLCVQNDPSTLVAGLVEAMSLCGAFPPAAWLVAGLASADGHEVLGLRISECPRPDATGPLLKLGAEGAGRVMRPVTDDKGLLEWLSAPRAARLWLSDGPCGARWVEQG